MFFFAKMGILVLSRKAKVCGFGYLLLLDTMPHASASLEVTIVDGSIVRFFDFWIA